MKKFNCFLLPNNQPEIYYTQVEAPSKKIALDIAHKMIKTELSQYIPKMISFLKK